MTRDVFILRSKKSRQHGYGTCVSWPGYEKAWIQIVVIFLSWLCMTAILMYLGRVEQYVLTLFDEKASHGRFSRTWFRQKQPWVFMSTISTNFSFESIIDCIVRTPLPDAKYLVGDSIWLNCLAEIHFQQCWGAFRRSSSTVSFEIWAWEYGSSISWILGMRWSRQRALPPSIRKSRLHCMYMLVRCRFPLARRFRTGYPADRENH